MLQLFSILLSSFDPRHTLFCRITILRWNHSIQLCRVPWLHSNVEMDSCSQFRYYFNQFRSQVYPFMQNHYLQCVRTRYVESTLRYSSFVALGLLLSCSCLKLALLLIFVLPASPSPIRCSRLALVLLLRLLISCSCCSIDSSCLLHRLLEPLINSPRTNPGYHDCHNFQGWFRNSQNTEHDI